MIHSPFRWAARLLSLAAVAVALATAGLAPAALAAPGAAQRLTVLRGEPQIAVIPGVENFKRSNNPHLLRAMREMLAGRADVKVAIMGDSTTFGYGSEGAGTFTGNRIDSPAYQLATKLTAAGVPASAENFFGTGGNVSSFANLLAAEPRLTLSGAGWNDYQAGIISSGGSILWNITASDFTSTFTFTTNTAVNACDIAFVTAGAAGNVVFKVDAGSDSAPLNFNGANGVSRQAISLGSSAAHAVTFRKTSANAYMTGLSCYDTTHRKVLVWNWGVNSASPSYWLNQTAAAYDVTNQYALFGQDLVLINCVINPQGSLGDPTSTIADIQTEITTFKANGSDVWIVMPHPVSNSTTVTPAYRAALRKLARDNNLTFIDLTFFYPTLTDWQNAGFRSDDQHPNTAGYGVNAARYQQLIQAAYKSVAGLQ